jgi:hypothetical protein
MEWLKEKRVKEKRVKEKRVKVERVKVERLKVERLKVCSCVAAAAAEWRGAPFRTSALDLPPTAAAATGGRDSVSATTLCWPAMCLISAVNTAIADSCRCCRSDLGSETLDRAPTSGLWSIKTTKWQPSRIYRKC